MESSALLHVYAYTFPARIPVRERTASEPTKGLAMARYQTSKHSGIPCKEGVQTIK